MMPIIVPHNFVTLEPKSTLHLHCSFPANDASDWPIYSSKQYKN